MSRPRKPVPDNIVVSGITLVIDGALKASPLTMTELAQRVGISYPIVSAWAQGWRMSRGQPIAAVPRDDDRFSALCVGLRLSPVVLEKHDYLRAAGAVRLSRAGDDPVAVALATVSTQSLLVELLERTRSEKPPLFCPCCGSVMHGSGPRRSSRSEVGHAA